MTTRGFAAVGLHQPKNALNVGEVMRAAGCFRAALVAVSGLRYQRARTDTSATHRHMPMLHCTDLQDVIPHGAVPVAVDIIAGAVPLWSYTHPLSAFYVFGPEDGTLGPDVLSWCRDVIYVPTSQCMNLAATVNVVLYDRKAKDANRRGALCWPGDTRAIKGLSVLPPGATANAIAEAMRKEEATPDRLSPDERAAVDFYAANPSAALHDLDCRMKRESP